jgi:U3 small nucleolar ribonucleoprotein protein LCP5
MALDNNVEEAVPTSKPNQINIHGDILDDVTKNAKAATLSIQSLIEKVKNGADTSKGISFLQMKNSLLLQYISNVSYIVLRKCSGKKIEGEPAIERLVKLRTVMEKIRPIEQKLRYQVDKLVSIAESGHVADNDPLRFKPNPDNLLTKQGDDSDDDNENDGEQVKKYIAPKNVPQHFDGNKTLEELDAENQVARKKHHLSKSLIEDLKRQHLDTPEEVHLHSDVKKNKLIEEERERTLYEEDNFIRLPITKADRQKRRAQMSTMGSIGDDITSFGASNFDGNNHPGKKRKSGNRVKKSPKKSKFKKRQ